MSGASRSVQVWAIYTFVVGTGLLLIPNVVLGVLQIEETNEIWIRVLGAVAVPLSLYYWYMARENSRTLFQVTVFGRGLGVVAFAVLALTGGPWQLFLFAGAEAVGVIWTYLTIRPSTA